MGAKSIKCAQYIMNDFLDVTNINTSEAGIKDIIDKLCSLCFSDKFANYIVYEFCAEYKDFISVFEMKEKYLLLKIFFQLMEELKNKNFEKHALNLIERNNSNINKFSEEHKDSIEKFEKSEKGKKLLKEIDSYVKDNSTHINCIYVSCSFIFFYTFKVLTSELNKKLKEKNTLDSDMYYFEYSEIKKNANNEEINEIIDILEKMDSLNHTKIAQKGLLFLLNLKINEGKISSKEIIDKNFFQKYGDININNKLKWKFYEQNISENNSDKKYNSIIFEGDMTEKEKYNLDIKEEINKIEMKEEEKKRNKWFYI